MNTITHTTGLDGVTMPVATFRGMSLEAARAAYERFYGHPDEGGFVVDDCALRSVIYLMISEADIEMHGVLVLPENGVVNS